jgi:hypothetical protein
MEKPDANLTLATLGRVAKALKCPAHELPAQVPSGTERLPMRCEMRFEAKRPPHGPQEKNCSPRGLASSAPPAG